MAKQAPCCCDMKALRLELERRAARKRSPAARTRALAPSRTRGPLDGVPTETLVRALRDQQRAVYGTDDRRDMWQVTSPALRTLAGSVAALVEAQDLKKTPSGRYRLATTSYQEEYGLCAGETFATQPLGCFCSGFLVAPDVAATAGHCVRSTSAAKRTRFVFGFHMLDQRRTRTVFAQRDVYAGAKLLGREEDAAGADWALVRLDRPVVGRPPLPVRTSAKIGGGQKVFVIGHPCGLPAKLAGGAAVRDNRRRAYFTANLDTYGGNSGSPVFDEHTRVVEGILASGEQDFVEQGDCMVTLVCPNAGCQGESVTRSTLWANRIPADD